MKWNPENASLSLTQADIRILSQCKMSFAELMQHKPLNQNIPPLWSILSYAMLQQSSSPENIWIHYRALKNMSKHASRYYSRRQIPKANGGVRELSVPNIFLQCEQTFIVRNILSPLPVDQHAYAYRKGVSIESCAQPHLQKDILIHLDIENFFGSITEDMVYETLLQQTGYAKSLCRFLSQLCCLRGRLPQGAATSPALSNLVFRKCDEALAQLAGKYELDYTRYCDDLFFSGSNSTDVTHFLKEASAALLRFGFRLNPDKTKVRRRQHCQSVLGLTVNDRIQVNRKYRRQLMQELYYLERFGKNSAGAIACGDYYRYMQKLQGKLAYVLRIDPDNRKLWDAHLKLTLRMNHYVLFQNF